jgi:hypothetical protein
MFHSTPFLSRRLRWLLVGLLALGLAGYWLLPIHGSVLIVPDTWRETHLWPKISVEPLDAHPGQRATIAVSDTAPWINVKLTVSGSEADFVRYEANAPAGYWTWYWSFIVPPQAGYAVVFYHDCNTGCVERTGVTLGALSTGDANSAPRVPTKLGIVFADPNRNWHNRSGWDVELTYAQQAETQYWKTDDLARRVQAAESKGLRVLVRVDYDKGQSLPPNGDYLALDAYLQYLRRLARDARLKSVYGYVIGSGYNAGDGNSLAPAKPVTPAWYARVFNGYDTVPSHQDNVVSVIRQENATVRVLVGPVRPWIADQNGDLPYVVNMPWLNYFNTLAAALNTSVGIKDAAGIPLAAPDGFAVQAPAWLEAPELGAAAPASEPSLDLYRAAWSNARIGFGVYRDWQDIINSYPYLRNRPLYITSANTYLPGTEINPAQNYPPGWLSAALEQANAEPQVQALCWYLDVAPLDKQWEFFSLAEPRGLLVEAADEFDQLLAAQP